MTDPKFDNVKTPLYAAVGAGDAVVQAVADVVAQVRNRAESTQADVGDRVDTARARLADLQEDVTESVETLRNRLEALPQELPEEIAELRERFTPEELRKVAEAYLKVASDLYTALAERGEETVERIRKNPQIEEGLERANKAANDAVDLTEDTLGTVASQTRAVGERAAALAGRASKRVQEGADEAAEAIKDGADEVSENLDEAGDKAKTTGQKASDKVSGAAGTVEGKTRNDANSPIKKTPAKKTTPAAKSTTPAKKTPAKKATPAKKSTS